MSIFDTIKKGVRRMLGIQEIKAAASTKPVVSQDMTNAIMLWTKMYEGKPPWLKKPTAEDPETVKTMGIPALLASERARTVTLEMESEITTPMIDVEETNPDYQPPGIDPETGLPTMGQGSMTITKSEPAGPTERADFMNKQYKKLLKNIRTQIEYGIAKGGLIIKPYPVFFEDGATVANSSVTEEKEEADITTPNNSALGNASNEEITDDPESVSYSDPLPKVEFEFDYIQADCFLPLAFDNNGNITESAFIQPKIVRDKRYTRVEHHILEGRTVTINNYAFVANNNQETVNFVRDVDGWGQPIPLTEVPGWENMEASVTIEDVDRPLYAYFKMPEANTVDTHSPMGVSCYSRATGLIRDADEMYSRLLWEYEGGEMAIDVDRNALILREMEFRDGHTGMQTQLPAKQQRLFRRVDLNDEETYNVFAPPLRDASLIHGLNTILVRIEDICGVSRGTISDVTTTDAKTATEMKILKQRTFATNKDTQQALEKALRDVIYIMDVYCDLYNITPAGDYEVSFEWDDSILIDSETELEKRMEMLSAGITSKVETRMWYFGETENQAKEALQKIEDEKKASMETNIVAQQELGEEAQGQDFSGDNNNPKPTNNFANNSAGENGQ